MTPHKPHTRRVVDLRNSHARNSESESRGEGMSFKRYAFLNRSAPAKEPIAKKKKKMPLRARRAYKRRGMMYGICALLVLAGAGLSALTFHPSVAITSVVVEGAQHLSANQIQTATLQALLSHEGVLYSKNTVLTADLKLVASELKASFPRIESVNVRRYGINTVKVSLRERVPFATWCDIADEGQCYHVDATGYIFEPVWGEKVSPALRGGVGQGDPLRSYVVKDSFQAVHAFVEAFRSIGMKSEQISISDDTVDARISFEQDPDVIVLLDDEPVRVARTIDAARNAASIKEKYASLEYIDARFGNRLYYKSKSEESVTDSSGEASAEESPEADN